MYAGILPDSGVIQAVPSAVEALCLAQRGTALVTSRQPLRCLVPLLTQPVYTRCDSAGGAPLVASSLCVSLTDLIRHLPSDVAVRQTVAAVAAAARVLCAQGGDDAALTADVAPQSDSADAGTQAGTRAAGAGSGEGSAATEQAAEPAAAVEAATGQGPTPMEAQRLVRG